MVMEKSLNQVYWSLGVAYWASCPPKKVLKTTQVRWRQYELRKLISYLKNSPVKPIGFESWSCACTSESSPPNACIIAYAVVVAVA